jgi:hypothetical protein
MGSEEGHGEGSSENADIRVHEQSFRLCEYPSRSHKALSTHSKIHVCIYCLRAASVR